MTEPFRGAYDAPSAASGTTALLSTDALRANARTARARSGEADPWAADAWGHGAGWVSGVLDAEGFTTDDVASQSGTDLYGLPGAGDAAVPVLRLSGRVLSTKRLRSGEGVSYGYLFRAPRDTHVALITGGYAQGVVRALGGRVEVVIGGVRCPIVGRVAMDVCVVDIGEHAVARGDEAVFFGDPRRGEPSLGEWVAASAFTAAEIVASVGAKAARREYR